MKKVRSTMTPEGLAEAMADEFDVPVATVKERLMRFQDYERSAVSALGESIGYGRMMQLSEELWREALAKDHGFSGGEHSVGPCVSQLVPCGCRERAVATLCDWCCGAHRVTKRVREAQRRARK